MATGTTRNRVALAPGHSLMDWVRLGNSGYDLSGVNGQALTVTKSELAKHNKRTDAWLAIRGMVYNVTRYMDFHPGGVDELIRGIGTDATKLFTEVHDWVNYESMLQKCVVGRLVCEEYGPTISTQVTESSFKMDWCQQISSMKFVFWTKTPYPEISITLNKPNEMCFVLAGKSWRMILHKNVNWPFDVSIINPIDGKVNLKITKQVFGVWSTFGTISAVRNAQIDYWKCKLLRSYDVTQNVKFLLFKYEENLYNHIYPGRHVYIQANVNGQNISRPYTPVVPLMEVTEYGPISKDTLCFLIKGYSNGKLSQHLCSLKEGDSIEVSRPYGNFACWKAKTSLILLAAGTGITPMIPIMTKFLHSKSHRYNITLLFCNTNEASIIWKKYIDQKTAVFTKRLTVHHILSEKESCEGSSKGHFDENAIIKCFPKFNKVSIYQYGVCICGPPGFNTFSEQLVRKLGFTKEDYFIFA